jgi:MFS transporter, DHA2 family, multidrug resistance protein
MQSIFGALLTAGYAAAIAKAVASAPNGQQITSSTEATLQKSFASAASLAQQYPQYANQIIAGAKASFHAGAQWAYLAGIIAILLGGALVFFLFPKRDEERKLLAEFHAEDTGVAGTAA